MALIRQSEQHAMVYNPVPMDVEDVRRRADELREQAEAHAREVVAEAQAERERLLAGAIEQGHAEGFAAGEGEGRERGREEGLAEAMRERGERLDALNAGWSGALRAFEEHRGDLLERAREDVLSLACAIAEMIVRRSVELDPTLIVEQMRAVLEAHARPTGLTLRVNPEDELLAREALPSLMAMISGSEHARLEVDGSVPRGSCVAVTDGGGVLDARIESQLERIVRELLPDGEAATEQAASPVDEPDAAPEAGSDAIGDAA
ncbi:MAG: hypothetical protein DHS20C14_05390 [Phycisphaeraceae bacterium]|nr:MAG: hypothetical protein DHS20C14_05390 [Phycisphaeraceae bacterium]